MNDDTNVTEKSYIPTPEEIDRHLRELFGMPEVAEQDATGEMIPACLGVLVKRAGGVAEITQADLDEINGSKLHVSVDPKAEKITLTMKSV